MSNNKETKPYAVLGDYVAAGEMLVTGLLQGDGVAVILVEGNPNTLQVSGVKYQLALDLTTGATWQNTDDNRAWAIYVPAGGASVPTTVLQASATQVSWNADQFVRLLRVSPAKLGDGVFKDSDVLSYEWFARWSGTILYSAFSFISIRQGATVLVEVQNQQVGVGSDIANATAGIPQQVGGSLVFIDDGGLKFKWVINTTRSCRTPTNLRTTATDILGAEAAPVAVDPAIPIDFYFSTGDAGLLPATANNVVGRVNRWTPPA